MRASLRCKEHHQGDRCTLPHLMPHEEHVGSFSRWNDRGAQRTVPLLPERDRDLSRVVTAIRCGRFRDSLVRLRMAHLAGGT